MTIRNGWDDVRCATAMPEEGPLQTFAALEVVREAELVVLVELLQEVEELR